MFEIEACRELPPPLVHVRHQVSYFGGKSLPYPSNMSFLPVPVRPVQAWMSDSRGCDYRASGLSACSDLRGLSHASGTRAAGNDASQTALSVSRFQRIRKVALKLPTESNLLLLCFPGERLVATSQTCGFLLACVIRNHEDDIHGLLLCLPYWQQLVSEACFPNWSSQSHVLQGSGCDVRFRCIYGDCS